MRRGIQSIHTRGEQTMSSRQRMTAQVMVGALMVVACFLPGAAHAQDVGPARGSLVIVGGAMRDPAIIERFIQLAGGPHAPIVVIPTAGGDETYGAQKPPPAVLLQQPST